MNVAAILPCGARSWLGLAIVSEEGGEFRYVATWGAEVGRLVPRAEPTEYKGKTYDQERVCTEDDAADVAKRVLTVLRANDVRRVLVEAPRGETAVAHRAAMVGGAITSVAEYAGIEVVQVDPLEEGYKRHVTVGELAAIRGWPSFSYDEQRHAAALLLPRTAPIKDSPRPDPESKLCGTELGHPASAIAVSAEPAAPEEPSEPPPKLGHRIAAIDPGTGGEKGGIGITIAEGTALPLTLIYATTLDFGRDVIKTGKNVPPGKTVRSFEDCDVDLAVEQIVDVLQRYEMDDVIVEIAKNASVMHAFHGVRSVEDAQKRARGLQPRMTQLLRTNRIAGEIQRAARMFGFRVLESVSEPTWSARVARKRKGEAGSVAERKRAAVRAGYRNWDPEADEHAIDAGGMILYVISEYHPPEESSVGVVRAPRKPRERRPNLDRRAKDRTRYAEKQEAERTRRAAAGCECKAKHKRECPLFVEKPPHGYVPREGPTAAE